MIKKTVFLCDISAQINNVVHLQGWVYNKRSSGKIMFLQFRDGTSTIQVVAIQSQLTKEIWSELESLTLESSVSIQGLVKEDGRSDTGYELELTDFSIIGLAQDDFPIGKKEHGPDFLLTHRHLWLRSQRQHAIMAIRSQIIIAIRKFYADHQFIQIDTPIFTPSACEGTTDLFEVDYFGEPAYLSQSGQLYLEAVLPSFNRVFDFQPVFRSEKSKTRRHLTEFWMSNAEASFVDLEENLRIQEQLIQAVIDHILAHCQTELRVLERDTTPLQKIKLPYPRLTHQEAVAMLQQMGSQIGFEDDLGAEDETILTQKYDQPIFITHYPAQVKAFYMKRNQNNPKLAECADLLAPEGHGEIIGGSQREDDYHTLLQSIKLHNLPVKDFDWYLDLRKYGSVPHSGFGVGLERLVKWICNLHHVRETIAFPRMMNRLRP
jgi:asparaginyl-tRNA synthetase